MNFLQKKKTFLAVMALTILGFSSAFAQTAQTPSPDKTAEQAELQRQLAEIEKQIAAYSQQLSQIKGEKTNLQNKINQLKNQQASLTLQIRATELQISNLGNKISETQATIEQNVEKAEKLKRQIAEFVRVISERDNDSLLYLLLTHENLTEALLELENSSQISNGLREILDETRATNALLAEQKIQLAEQQEDANNLLSIQSLQRGKLAGAVTEQNDLLRETKGRESDYQAVLSNTQKRAAEIRNRLYQLAGGSSSQVTFGEAVQIAQWASQQTGVRAAFLLAILTQESSLGKNVGTCNRPGDPPEKSWRVIMKPDRDQKPFLQVTEELGLNPDVTPVSCPMKDKKGKQIGWGGAMGPAQFIPSTWMGYKDKVAVITGKAANPWDIRDAFIAAAIKLKAGGAGTVSGEWAAAMRYFSGGTNTKYRFYGDNVVAMANQYQNDIEVLK